MKRDVHRISQPVLRTCSRVFQINNAFLSILFATLRKVKLNTCNCFIHIK